MQELRAAPGKPKTIRSFVWLPAMCLISAPLPAFSQQSSPSGTVETFDPAFDIGIAHRPRAGIYGITDLMMAALEADIAKAKQLVDAGAAVNETDDSQSTPLMWAVHSGDVEIVKFLISEGADVHARAFQGATALINAIAGKHEAIAIILIEAGADPNGRGNGRRSFLEAAAEPGLVGVVDALIRNGADLSSYGPSALSYAVSRGHYDVSVLLLNAGVDPNLPATLSETPILSRASASGNLNIVKLLLSHGADASQPQGHRSPLYAAVSRGHSAVAELLIGNGAIVTSEHVLAAIQQQNPDTAIALINRVDIDTFQTSEVESLLAAADERDDKGVLQLLHQSASVRSVIDEQASAEASALLAASREHARLLFARQTDDDCVIGLWDSRSGDSAELARTAKCPDDVFVSEDGHSAFVIDGTVLRIVSIGNSADSTEVALPDPDYRAWVDQMTLRPDQNPDYLPSMPTMRPIGVGRFDDGSLGLLASLWMPADDEFHYLFRRDGGQWSIAEARWCNRLGCEEPIDLLSFRSTNIWNWPETSMIWHENLTSNLFFLEESVQMVDLEFEDYQAAVYQRRFEIDGALSVLRFSTSPSEHSDTDHTFGIELTIDGKPPRELSGNQCLTSLVGRFILVYEFFGGRFEVTDLGTGKTVVGDLKAALWLD